LITKNISRYFWHRRTCIAPAWSSVSRSDIDVLFFAREDDHFVPLGRFNKALGTTLPNQGQQPGIKFSLNPSIVFGGPVV
jgi:hypothetical protein